MKKEMIELVASQESEKSVKVRATWRPPWRVFSITAKQLKAAEVRARLVHGDYLRLPENLIVRG